MKICKRCKKELALEKFRGQNKKLSSGIVKRYLRSNCRKCEKKVYYKEDGYHYVYFLPISNYVGMTCNIRRRMRQHKENGVDISNYSILGKFDRSVEAHLFETSYHVAGYNGYQYSGLDG